MENNYPLLSGSFEKTLQRIYEKHNDLISEELLSANALINTLPDLFDKTECIEEINELITDEARMLSIRNNSFSISYLPKGRMPEYSSNGIWSRKNRQEAKPARIIQKVLKNHHTCKEFEDFSNRLKTEIMFPGEFSLVEGEDIRKYYDASTYFKETGTLGNSCMRYESCQDFFDVYVDNAKMLIYKDGNDNLYGRAIVWSIDKEIYMDRIYTCFDNLIECFIDYAKDNKWWYCFEQSPIFNGEHRVWTNGEINISKNLCIPLKKKYYAMPYMDSFRYYWINENAISTDFSIDKCSILSSTQGFYCDEFLELICPYCGKRAVVPADGFGEEDFEAYHFVLPYNETGYICADCAKYCDGIDAYVRPDDVIVDVIDDGSFVYKYPLSYVNKSLLSDKIDASAFVNGFVYVDDYIFRVVGTRHEYLNINNGQFEIKPDKLDEIRFITSNRDERDD